jgi:opacity protein-like surface antigen
MNGVIGGGRSATTGSPATGGSAWGPTSRALLRKAAPALRARAAPAAALTLAGLSSPCSVGHLGDTAPFNVAALPVTDSLSEKLEWFGTVRGRIGPTITPTFLAYLTGGLAYGQVKLHQHGQRHQHYQPWGTGRQPRHGSDAGIRILQRQQHQGGLDRRRRRRGQRKLDCQARIPLSILATCRGHSSPRS